MEIITECLQHVANLNNELGVERKQMLRRYLESYDEQQLIHLLSHQGIYANDIEINGDIQNSLATYSWYLNGSLIVNLNFFPFSPPNVSAYPSENI